MAEITALRTRFAKHFDTETPGVRQAQIGAGPLHYRHPDGHWEDMANLLQPSGSGFTAQTAGVAFGIDSGYLTVTYRGRTLTMRPTSVAMVDRTAPASRFRKLADASYATVSRVGPTVTVHDIFPGVDLAVSFTDEEMSKAFTITSKPSLPDPVSLGWDPSNTYLAFLWDVTLPSGAGVRVADTQAAFSVGTVVNGDLQVFDQSTGDTVVTFAQGIATGATRRTGPVYYVNAGAVAPFAEAIPYARTQTAQYPLVVDPTTSIAVTAAANNGTVTKTVVNAGAPSYGSSTAKVEFGHTNYDDGKGTVTDTVERAFLRFDLSSLAGQTVTAARLGCHPLGVTGGTVYETASDWGTLDNSDWSLGVSSVGSFSGIATPSPGGIVAASGTTAIIVCRSYTAGAWRCQTDTEPGRSGWTALSLSSNYESGMRFEGVATNGSGWWVIAKAHGISGSWVDFHYSKDDGATWSKQAVNLSTQDVYLGSLRYLNGEFVYIAPTSSPFGCKVAHVADPAGTWSVASWSPMPPVAGEGFDIAYGAGLYVVVGRDSNANRAAIWTASTIGGTLTQRYADSTQSNPFASVVFDGTTFVAGGNSSGATMLATSTDGTSWTQRYTAGLLGLGISYGNGRWYLQQSGAAPKTSTDPTNTSGWSSLTGSIAGASIANVAWDGTRWVAAATQAASALGMAEVFWSTDGTTFTGGWFTSLDATAVNASVGGVLPIEVRDDAASAMENLAAYGSTLGPAFLSITYTAGYTPGSAPASSMQVWGVVP